MLYDDIDPLLPLYQRLGTLAERIMQNGCYARGAPKRQALNSDLGFDRDATPADLPQSALVYQQGTQLGLLIFCLSVHGRLPLSHDGSVGSQLYWPLAV